LLLNYSEVNLKFRSSIQHRLLASPL